MSILRFFSTGLRNVGKYPSLVLSLYLASVVLALPLAMAMRGVLQEGIGDRLVHENLRQGFDLAWYGEFKANSGSDLAETFGPSMVGILPALGNLETLLDGKIFQVNAAVFFAGLLFLLAWAFFAGGILDRFARPGEVHSRARFFSHSGEYFFRFVRLLLLSVLLYWLLFRWVANPLHDWVEKATRDVTTEKMIMLATFAVYALVGLLLMVFTMGLDYAKIAMVAEKRRSALLAFLRGLGFAFSHRGRTFGLYLLLAGVGLLLLILYALAAPGPGQTSWVGLIAAFLLGQAYLLARLVLKLWFLASQTVLFQSTARME